jgi:hypothetical protein
LPALTSFSPVAYSSGRQWTYILLKYPKKQTAKRKTGAATGGSGVNVNLRTNRNLVNRHVNARTDWDEKRATIEFKKLAGVQQSLPCKLRLENKAGEKVGFQINAAFTSTWVVAR